MASSGSSACSSVEEAKSESRLSALASSALGHVSEYLRAELDAQEAEYALLANMNELTSTKYADLRQIADNVSVNSKKLNDKYEQLSPYLEQIDKIDENVTKIEAAAFKLDAYSRQLEKKFEELRARNK